MTTTRRARRADRRDHRDRRPRPPRRRAGSSRHRAQPTRRALELTSAQAIGNRDTGTASRRPDAWPSATRPSRIEPFASPRTTSGPAALTGAVPAPGRMGCGCRSSSRSAHVPAIPVTVFAAGAQYPVKTATRAPALHQTASGESDGPSMLFFERTCRRRQCAAGGPGAGTSSSGRRPVCDPVARTGPAAGGAILGIGQAAAVE